MDQDNAKLSLGGESELLDGAISSSRQKEDGYRADDSETDNEAVEIEEDEEDEEDSGVVELGMSRPVGRDDEDDLDAQDELEEIWCDQQGDELEKYWEEMEQTLLDYLRNGDPFSERVTVKKDSSFGDLVVHN